MFAKCVTAWIVRGSEGLFHTVHFAECLDDVRVKASVLDRYGFVKELRIREIIFRREFWLPFLPFD